VKTYVNGFLFSPDGSKVVLIRKNRPKWQVGRLNGVGGHVEPDETPAAAMRREFEEETGLDVGTWAWRLSLVSDSWVVQFFAAFSHSYNLVRATTDEEVGIYDVDALYALPVIPNLWWLVPLCRDTDVLPSTIFDTSTVGGD